MNETRLIRLIMEARALIMTDNQHPAYSTDEWLRETAAVTHDWYMEHEPQYRRLIELIADTGAPHRLG